MKREDSLKWETSTPPVGIRKDLYETRFWNREFHFKHSSPVITAALIFFSYVYENEFSSNSRPAYLLFVNLPARKIILGSHKYTRFLVAVALYLFAYEMADGEGNIF